MFILLWTFLPTIIASQNVALNKPAQQVTEKDTGRARQAVDGNSDGTYTHGSCSHTIDEPVGSATWWKVDLMGFYQVTSVEIFTRTDCCSERLRNFEVRVSLSNPVSFPSSDGQQCFNRTDKVPAPGIRVDCIQPIIGRYVSLFKATLDPLTICEFRVFVSKTVIEVECEKTAVQLTSPAANLLTICGYSVVMDNSRLIIPTFKSFHGVSAIRCATECAQTDSCFGFNSMTSAAVSNNSVTCELLLGLLVFVPFGDPVVSQQNGWRVFYTGAPLE